MFSILYAPKYYISGFLFYMNDELYIKRAIKLALKGKGKVSPNPLVGAVIVKNGKIIGEGYHKCFGAEHAETAALKSASTEITGAALYCNLEPCVHWGKTPPCANVLIASGIKKVVIGMLDPNPLVCGKGILFLQQSGIEVVTGILENTCKSINEPYIKYITTGLPYITVKMAQSIDGKITPRSNTRYVLSGREAQHFVHRLRTEYDAVLIGRRTAEIDNPLLTPRLVKGRVPVRIILDTNLSLNPELKIFETISAGRIIVATASHHKERILRFQNIGAEVLSVNSSQSGRVDLKALMKRLGESGISSVLVEGGAAVFSDLLSERLVDRIMVIITPYMFGDGVSVLPPFERESGLVELTNVIAKRLGKDYLLNGNPVYRQE